MKSSIFLLSFFVCIFYSCKQRTTNVSQKKNAEQSIVTNQSGIQQKPADNNINSTTKPDQQERHLSDTKKDSGYFKGYPSEKIAEIEESDTTPLSKTLSQLISKKEIILLDSQTLTHSVFINQRKKLRFDTLRNNHTLITSEYKFSEKGHQVIKLNGKVIRKAFWKNEDSDEDILDFKEEFFRHFLFKGQEFYYIQARIMDGQYGSIHTITYHLILNSKAKALNSFITCRFDKILFGDANKDKYLDYLDFNNSDFCTGVPASDRVTINLYSCDDKGNFVLQKDRKGKIYFIDARTGEVLSQDSLIIQRLNWPVPVGK